MELLFRNVLTEQCQAGVDSLVQTRLSLSRRSSVTQWRIRQHGNAEECEFTGNNALWWILRGRDTSLETGREMIFSTYNFYKNPGIILELCGKREVLQNSSRRGWSVWSSTPACREHSRPRQEAGSTVLGAISEGTVIGPVQQFIVVKIMERLELKLRFFHQVNQNKIPGLCFVEEWIATWMTCCRRHRFQGRGFGFGEVVTPPPPNWKLVWDLGLPPPPTPPLSPTWKNFKM